MSELKKVNLSADSIFPIIEEYRERANYTTHEYSNAIVGETISCSDNAVIGFLNELQGGIGNTQLCISDISWEETGNCVGDDLYPVLLEAVRLPSGTYYLVLSGLDINEEYIYTL